MALVGRLLVVCLSLLVVSCHVTAATAVTAAAAAAGAQPHSIDWWQHNQDTAAVAWEQLRVHAASVSAAASLPLPLAVAPRPASLLAASGSHTDSDPTPFNFDSTHKAAELANSDRRFTAQSATHSVGASPAAAASASVAPRFHVQWHSESSLPACTSEIHGDTHQVISASQWSRINFAPTGGEFDCANVETVPAQAGPSEPGLARCYASCKTGYVNLGSPADGQAAGVSAFTCAYDSGAGVAGQLSEGPNCAGLYPTGLSDGDATWHGNVRSLGLALDGGLLSGGILEVVVDCPGHNLNFPHISFGPDDSESFSDGPRLTVVGNEGGHCVFRTERSSDSRLLGWQQTVYFTGPKVIATSTDPAAPVLTNGVTELTITTTMPVVGGLPISVTCVDDSVMLVTVLSRTVNVPDGQSGLVLPLTAPPSPSKVTCTFVVAGGDPNFANVAPSTFSFLTERPTLSFSGIRGSLWPNGIEVLKTGATYPFFVDSSHRALGAPIRVNISCTSGTLSGSTFVLGVGGSTYTMIYYLAPAVRTDLIVCSFALLPGGDPRFAGTVLPPVLFAADVAPTLSVAMAPQIGAGATERVFISLSRPLEVSSLLYAVCNAGQFLGLIDGQYHRASAGATSAELAWLAPPDENPSVTCGFAVLQGDLRYSDQVVWQARAVSRVAFGLAGLAAGQELVAGSAYPLALELSHAAWGSELHWGANCTLNGEAVGRFDPPQLVVPSGARNATVYYSPPSGASLSGVECTFRYASGDARYDTAAARAGTVLTVSVVQPLVMLAGLAGGSVLQPGQQVALAVTVSPAPSGDLLFWVVCAENQGNTTVGTLVPATLTVPFGQQSSAGTVVFTAPLEHVPSGSCSVSHLSGDTRFEGVLVDPALFSVETPVLTLSGLVPGAAVRVRAQKTLTLLSSHEVAGSDVLVAITCPGATVTPAAGFTVAVGSNSATVQLVAPASASAAAITCTLSFVDGDPRFTHSAMPPLSFTAVVPTLALFGLDANAVLLAGEQSDLTVAVHPPPSSTVTLRVDCGAAGTVYPSEVSLDAGEASRAVRLNHSATGVAAASCNVVVVDGGADDMFARMGAATFPFSVLKPVLTFTGVINGAALLTGTRANLTVTANAPIVEELRLTVKCMPSGSPDITVLDDILIIAAGETSSFVSLTAPLQPTSAGVECKVFPLSGDSRFNNAAVTDAVPTIAFTTVLPTVTLNGLTEGAQVQAGSTQQITLTVSDVIIDIDDLSVNVTCPGTAVSGYFRVHTGTTLSTVTRVVVPVNATVGTTFTCTFKYLRGDIRYTNAAMPTPVSFSVAPVPVVEPSSSSSTGGGDSASSTAGGADDGSSAGDASGSSTADAASDSSSSAGSATDSSTADAAAGSASFTGDAADSSSTVPAAEPTTGSSSGPSVPGSSSSGSADSSSGDQSGPLSSTGAHSESPSSSTAGDTSIDDRSSGDGGSESTESSDTGSSSSSSTGGTGSSSVIDSSSVGSDGAADGLVAGSSSTGDFIPCFDSVCSASARVASAGWAALMALLAVACARAQLH